MSSVLSPSCPGRPSSPVPPVTADHVHLAHWTGDSQDIPARFPNLLTPLGSFFLFLLTTPPLSYSSSSMKLSEAAQAVLLLLSLLTSASASAVSLRLSHSPPTPSLPILPCFVDSRARENVPHAPTAAACVAALLSDSADWASAAPPPTPPPPPPS